MHTRGFIDYDWFKLAVAIILALLLLTLLLTGRRAPAAALPAAGSAAPTLTAPAGRAFTAPLLTRPAAGEQVQVGPVTLGGTADPGADVRVLIDGQPAGTARAGDDGAWSLDVTLDKPGDHAVVVQVLDSAGAVAVAARPVTLAAAAPQPQIAAPTLKLPAAPLAAGEVTLNGTGTPNTQVELLVDGKSAGTAQVGADGAWSLAATLAPGDHEIAVRARDAAGAVVATASPAHLTVAAPAATAAPAAQVATAAAPTAAPIAAQAPALTFPVEAAQLPEGKLALAGTGAAGSVIEILDGDQVLGTTTVGADGTWRYDVTPAVGPHVYGVRVAGETAAPVARAQVMVGAAAAAPQAPAVPQAPAITFPAEGAQLGTGEFTMAGTGAPGSELEILDSNKVIGKVTVGADGSWSLPITPAAGTASYGVRPVGAADLAGKPIRVMIGEAPVATCTSLAAGCDAWVTRQQGRSLRLRAGAGLDQQVIDLLPIGTQLKLLEGPQHANDLNWWHVQTPGGPEGWVAGEELRLQPD